MHASKNDGLATVHRGSKKAIPYSLFTSPLKEVIDISDGFG